ncbi:hypothetical protein BBW65_00230 [Helicobacter enhydrae]|uniref:Molybdopterin-synthase adenylyltransferase n=1 Tax=Helicobacter enhydrae TaxID=222136 RepID=A0A1B1U3L3_9HELI|nr:HesA/MoeB/ThiF family protein [Helicobacter enhydrae]ANV97341.1 hypothetical protein BBW65_00230 [Helicobacter enhydrae]
MLTLDEKQRYSRHLMLEEVGEEGQMKLKQARVLLIGCGALGSPNALYLAGAGIGKIGLVDDDTIDVSNLHRQITYKTQQIGLSKVLCAKEAIWGINPDVEVQTYQTRFNKDNALELIADYDFIIDGSDNFASKFLLNQACVLAQKPYTHAGIVRHMGQAMTYLPDHACLACVFPSPPSDASLYKPGLFGTLPAMLGMIQATEAIKYFTQVGTPLSDALLNVEITSMSFRKIQIAKNPKCPVCGSKAKKELVEITCH